MSSEPKRLGIRDARATFPSIVDAAAAGKRFVITFHDDDRCAIVSMDDLAKLDEIEARKPRKGR